MIAFLSGLSVGATALLARLYWQRHKAAEIRHAGHPQPCRRCGARN